MGKTQKWVDENQLNLDIQFSGNGLCGDYSIDADPRIEDPYWSTEQKAGIPDQTTTHAPQNVVGRNPTTQDYKANAENVSSQSVVGKNSTTHRRRPSGWIEKNYRIRLPDGRRRTLANFQPGATGPYYRYCWVDGKKRTKYLKPSQVVIIADGLDKNLPVEKILKLLG